MGVILAAAACAFLFGALLPLPAYRFSVPMDRPPRGTCDHCGRTLRWFAPPPTRCPQCRSRLGPPWWVTAGVAAVAGAVLAAALAPQPVLVLFVALAVLGTGLAAIDIACRRLPAAIVVPAIVASTLSLLVLAAFTGDWGSLGRALLAALALGLCYELLYLVPGGNLGYGDVRLAVLLGLVLGWLGWAEVIWGALLPWLVNAPVVLTLLLLGRVGRKSRVPFGPAMLVGALLSVTLVASLPI